MANLVAFFSFSEKVIAIPRLETIPKATISENAIIPTIVSQTKGLNLNDSHMEKCAISARQRVPPQVKQG